MDTFAYKYWSASSVKTLLQCALKFKYAKIDRLEGLPPTGHYGWFGSLVHNAIYGGMADFQDAKTFTLFPEAEEERALAFYEVLWDIEHPEEITDEVLKSIADGMNDKPINNFMPGKIKALQTDDQVILEREWKKIGRKMVKNGMKVIDPLMSNVIDIERQIFWEYLGRQFVGYIDILVQDDDGIYSFYDLKTSWQVYKLPEDFQFFAYSYALKQLLDLDYYPQGNLIHLRSGRVHEAPQNELSEKYFTKKVKKAFEYAENNVFFNSKGHPLCGYCPFQVECYGSVENVWNNKEKRYF